MTTATFDFDVVTDTPALRKIPPQAAEPKRDPRTAGTQPAADPADMAERESEMARPHAAA